MKRRTITLFLSLLMGALLTGCANESNTTSTSNTETTETTTENSSEKSDSNEVKAGPLDDATYAELTSLFAYEVSPHNNWYLRALTSYYSTPEEIDLRYLFWSGCNDAQPTQEEQDYALANDSEGNAQYADLMRVTENGMNEILDQYLGISLSQTSKDNAFTNDLYCDKTGNYLLWRSEDVTRDVTFTGGTMLNNGDVELSYYDTYATEYKGIVTLRKENDTWKILSNRSADGKAHY